MVFKICMKQGIFFSLDSALSSLLIFYGVFFPISFLFLRKDAFPLRQQSATCSMRNTRLICWYLGLRLLFSEACFNKPHYISDLSASDLSMMLHDVRTRFLKSRPQIDKTVLEIFLLSEKVGRYHTGVLYSSAHLI